MKGNVFHYILYFFVAVMIFLLISTLPTTAPEYIQFKNNFEVDTHENIMPTFVDETLIQGIAKPHMQSSDKLSGIPESFGAGACAFDYNNDGWMDLFLVNGSGQRRYFGEKEWWQSETPFTLYKNTGLNSFEDVTDIALGGSIKGWGMGCSAADLDNDGDQDLIISNFGANILLENKADGTFENSTDHAGLQGKSWSTSILTADFNNDGLLDIYILNFIKYEKGLKTYEASSGYSTGKNKQFITALFDSVPNQLYINKGNLVFEDKTAESGLADSSGRGMSAEALDINNDGFIDIFISNGQGSPNKLFLNDGKLNFIDASESYNISTIKQSTGVSIADINSDGSLDLLVGTDNKNSKLLYIKNKEGFLVDTAKELGIDKTKTSGAMTWGAILSDLNNDGKTDIFLANGFTNPDLLSPRKPQSQPNTLLINTSEGFKNCNANCYLKNDEDSGSSRSVITVDTDNDGDKDLYITQNNSLGKLLINHTPNKNWLGIKLIGSRSNKDAIGSLITLETDKRKYVKQISNASFLSSQDKRVLFNYNNETVKNLSIIWSNGEKSEIATLPQNRYIIIQEGSNIFSTYHYTSENPIKSKIVFSKQSFRLEIIDWLASSGFKNEASIEASLVLNEKLKDQSLLKILKITDLLKPQVALKAYSIGIKNDNVNIRLKAIEKLTSAEEEVTSRFLLNLFSDSSARVRCEVAKTYQHFFREEEAMVHSKYQAIPKLIHALADNNDDVKICAINALGESENYRAVKPLMQLISSIVVNSKIKSSAITALGRLREKKAEGLLTNIFHDPKEAIKHRYTALSALKRLNIIDERKFLKENLISYNNKGYISDLLEILLSLSRDQEHNIIISPVSIRESLLEFSSNKKHELSPKVLAAIRKTLLAAQHGGVKKENIEEPKKLAHKKLSEKEMKRILSTPTESIIARISILKNQKITRLNSTRSIIKTISNNKNDPLHMTALVFLVENASKKREVSFYKNEMLDKNRDEDYRFHIAKGLFRKNPTFVIDNILAE